MVALTEDLRVQPGLCFSILINLTLFRGRFPGQGLSQITLISFFNILVHNLRFFTLISHLYLTLFF
jgi:hypothetical protein